MNLAEMKNCYDMNETMKMLGHQKIGFIFYEGMKEKIDDITVARPFTVTENTAIDIFMLGYIYGKRAERAKRKKGGALNA